MMRIQEQYGVTTPLGLKQVGGKRPMEVVVSVASQLISQRQYQQFQRDSKLPKQLIQ